MEMLRLPTWARIAAVVVLVVGGSVAVGVWASADDGLAAPAAIEDQADTLEGFEAEKVTVIQRGNHTVRTVESVARRPGTGAFRTQEVTSDPTGREMRVSNGSTLWLYTEGDRTVQRTDGVNTTGSLLPRVERLFAIVNREPGSEHTDHSIEPLPIVPAQDDQPTGIAGAMTVEYRGVETVDGRSTNVLYLESNATTAGVVEDFEQTLWLDREWYLPLKQRTTYVNDGVPVSITVTYRNVSFNPGLDAGTFTFEPPANVTVVETQETRQTTFVDVASLRAAASFSVPEPDLPRSFRLVEATRTVHNHVRSIGLTYANDTAVVSISKSNLTWYQPGTNGTAVSVGDHDATLRNLGTELRVSWATSEARYSVAASGVPKPTLLEIARSIASERS